MFQWPLLWVMFQSRVFLTHRRCLKLCLNLLIGVKQLHLREYHIFGLIYYVETLPSAV